MSDVVERFFEICAQYGEAFALISDEESVTYQDLECRVHGLAHSIDQWFEKALGRKAGPGDVIGVSLEKNVNLYVAILAILAVGASYVPLDPGLDEGSEAHILKRCDCLLVLSSESVSKATRDVGTLCVTRAVRTEPLVRLHDRWASRASNADRCYTIFTSGSTGQPKGVPITHRNLMSLVDWMVAEFALGPSSRLLQYSTVSFDASVLDIFPALLSGASLCIPTNEQRLSHWMLEDVCARHSVDHAFLPPALLAVLDAERFSSLHTVLTGGEPCCPATVESWSRSRRLYNLYGPTECTVCVSFKRMEFNTEPVNIGQAIPGARLYVLDEALLPASLGELHIAGVPVAQGYVGDSQRTDERFITCPLLDEGVLYRTGDIVKRDPSGDLHFLGRMDRQLKVRGYRVELEEIEGALMRLGCAQAAVKVSRSGDLVAYVASTLDESNEQLLHRLAKVLADYKLPRFLIRLDVLPQTLGGKVNYQALPDASPLNDVALLVGSNAGPSSTLACIAQVWAEVLDVEPQAIQAQSNFRDLGGTSIKVVRLLGKMEERFDVRIALADFLNDPTPHFLQSAINHHEPPHSSLHEPHRPHRTQHRGHA